jgi:hypothetical protein
MLPYLKPHTIEEKRPGRVASGRLVPDREFEALQRKNKL